MNAYMSLTENVINFSFSALNFHSAHSLWLQSIADKEFSIVIVCRLAVANFSQMETKQAL